MVPSSKLTTTLPQPKFEATTSPDLYLVTSVYQLLKFGIPFCRFDCPDNFSGGVEPPDVIRSEILSVGNQKKYDGKIIDDENLANRQDRFDLMFVDSQNSALEAHLRIIHGCVRLTLPLFSLCISAYVNSRLVIGRSVVKTSSKPQTLQAFIQWQDPLMGQPLQQAVCRRVLELVRHPRVGCGGFLDRS